MKFKRKPDLLDIISVAAIGVAAAAVVAGVIYVSKKCRDYMECADLLEGDCDCGCDCDCECGCEDEEDSCECGCDADTQSPSEELPVCELEEFVCNPEEDNM